MDRTPSDLQAQIDQLSLTLREWRETPDAFQPIERRLVELTERCAEILNRWADTDHRHAHALSELEVRLGEWSAMEHRLEEDSVQRVRELQATLEREWKTLRELHDAPARELRAQAAALSETCVAAANLALRGFEQAEARLSALETDVRDKLDRLTLDVRTALAELKQAAALGAAPPPVEPFPLESVMRIHDELRHEPDRRAESALTVVPSVPSPAAPSATQHLAVRTAAPADLAPMTLTTALVERVGTLEHDVAESRQHADDAAARARQTTWYSRVALVAVALLIVGGGLALIVFRDRIDARFERAAASLEQTARGYAGAADAASQQALAARDQTDREIAGLRQESQRAELVTNVLAAPDLVRFQLAGRGSSRMTAKMLWSRTSGLVLTAAGLPALPAGRTYEAWFLGLDAPVGICVFAPDRAGRVNLAIQNPSNLPGLVTGVQITEEPAGGQPAPSGPAILAQR